MNHMTIELAFANSPLDGGINQATVSAIVSREVRLFP